MSRPQLELAAFGPEIDALRLDLSTLVGYDLEIYSQQFPGKQLTTRVMACAGREIQISNAGGDGLVDNLVSRQTLVVKFRYKGQHIAVRARLKRTLGGRSFLELDERVVPLAQRRFFRVPLMRPVDLAAYPTRTFAPVDIAKLRWLKTETVNFSSGGALVHLSSYVQPDILLLMHFDLPQKFLPDLVLARVRHCFQLDFSRYNVGVEFVVREASARHVSNRRLPYLPETVFKYTSTDRERKNYEIQAWMQQDDSHTTGKG